jgi:hypothetical protein
MRRSQLRTWTNYFEEGFLYLGGSSVNYLGRYWQERGSEPMGHSMHDKVILLVEAEPDEL